MESFDKKSKWIRYFKGKPLDLPKMTILLDNGYHYDFITKNLETEYSEIMVKIQLEYVPKPSKKEKGVQEECGFIPVNAWWVVERSNAWIERCQSLIPIESLNFFYRLLIKKTGDTT
ncbi:hypothetical protein [Candidatus Albibeggiatoa sp. nov. NOAA]|uniref:hypothetical protein n=1 Tax=Candidatus Albibeggiatoa sp. nov. NOAA TaxID=3162724 RepID=UPI0032F3D37B|nr:transposase [Thiotrichaceae bacterium]